jgi:amino acid permease
VLVVTICLTWTTDVNAIIAYASRAFALFYTLQTAAAAIVAYQIQDVPKRTQKIVFFSTISTICLLVFLLGLPAE